MINKPWFKKQELSKWSVLQPRISVDTIELIYSGGTINSIFTIDEAKDEIKYLLHPKRKFKSGLLDRRLALEHGVKMVEGRN